MMNYASDEKPRPRPKSMVAHNAKGANHAPAGGVTVGGTKFTGGEFIPGSVMAEATPAERKKVEGSTPPSPAKEAKPRATKGAMLSARREGKAVVMTDGSEPPAHIKPSMIPPQWSDVQVSVDPDADVLVKARDAAGRIKTVYSDSFSMKTAATKFSRVRDMMGKAAEIHTQNQANRQSADPAARDAADVTWLIQEQGTRPGSDGDTKARVKAYGATTLRAEHIVEGNDGVRLQFIGKEGVRHDHLVRDKGLASMLLERKRTADSRDGRLFTTTAEKLNKYIGTLDGGLFTAKDFRTLRANKLAVEAIKASPGCCATAKDYKAKVKAVAETVSHVLGNRPSQALESYIDPTVFSEWSSTRG